MAKAGVKKRKAGNARGFPPDRAAELYKRLARARPDPKTELEYRDPFTLLVSVVLSAQATDVSVNKATPALFAEADTPAKMVKLGEAGIARHIKTIGLWRMKARNVLALSRIILERHDGKTPGTREELEALPGVGHKTASVVLNEAFGQSTIAVDTHVFRVSNRTGLAPGPTPEKVEKLLLEVTPKKYRRGAHHWLILHGRYTCLARKPGCPECAIRELCDYEDKTPAAASAASAKRKGSNARAGV
jgi:endonuclease-3